MMRRYATVLMAIFGLSALIAASSRADAQLVREFAGRSVTRTPSRIAYARLTQLKSLRARSLEQQRSDGGKLTDQHRDELQAELDRVNASYDKQLANNDPLTLNADGSSVKDPNIHQNWTYAKPILTGVVP